MRKFFVILALFLISLSGMSQSVKPVALFKVNADTCITFNSQMRPVDTTVSEWHISVYEEYTDIFSKKTNKTLRLATVVTLAKKILSDGSYIYVTGCDLDGSAVAASYNISTKGELVYFSFGDNQVILLFPIHDKNNNKVEWKRP